VKKQKNKPPAAAGGGPPLINTDREASDVLRIRLSEALNDLDAVTEELTFAKKMNQTLAENSITLITALGKAYLEIASRKE
jgi:hypothetical protein